MDISLNETLVTASENTYPYRTYVEATLNFGREAKKSHLTSALYYRDSSNHLDDTQGDDKSGLKVRRQLSSRSHEIDMLGRLHTDIMHQERYMINGVDVKIRLIPSKEYLSFDGPRCCCRVQNCHHSCLFVCSQGEAQPSSSAGSRKSTGEGNGQVPTKKGGAENFCHSYRKFGNCARQSVFDPDSQAVKPSTDATTEIPSTFRLFTCPI